jgi:hypothetical protein
VERTEIVLVSMILVFLVVALFVATDLSSWIGVVTEALRWKNLEPFFQPTSSTCTSPGPCIPTTSDISMSPERLGPVWKQTFAGRVPPAYFRMASGTVRNTRSTGSIAT